MTPIPTQKRVCREDVNFRVATFLLAAVAVLISILAVVYTRGAGLRYDEKYYFALAERIAGGIYDDGYLIRPPLYPLFLAGMFKIFGTGFTAALVVQGLIRGGIVAQISYMGRKYVSARSGLLAGALLAVYPFLIWVHTRFLNEAVYLPLFLLSFHMVERSVRSGRPSDSFKAGLCSGLASLARATSFFLTIVIAVWLVVRRSKSGRFSKRNLVNACLLIIALFAAVSPWTIRNAVVHKGLMPIGNESAFNLWFIVSGVNLSQATDQWVSWGTQVERQREGLRRWRDYVIDNPAFHIKRMIKRLPRIFNPDEQRAAKGLGFIPQRGGARQHRIVSPFLDVFVPVMFVIVAGGGLIGLAIVKDEPSRRMLAIITVLYFIFLYAPTIMKARYFLPILCLLSIYAARLIVMAVDSLRKRL